MGRRKKGMENGPEILWVGGRRWCSPGGLLGGGDRKALRRLEKYCRGKWRPRACAQLTVKKNWVVHVFPPTWSAVRRPRDPWSGSNPSCHWPPCVPRGSGHSSKPCCLLPGMQVPAPLSAAMSLAGIPYGKAHSRRSINILSCR